MFRVWLVGCRVIWPSVSVGAFPRSRSNGLFEVEGRGLELCAALSGGKHVRLRVAHTKLSYCRAFIVRAYVLQTREMLFDALTHAFSLLGCNLLRTPPIAAALSVGCSRRIARAWMR